MEAEGCDGEGLQLSGRRCRGQSMHPYRRLRVAMASAAGTAACAACRVLRRKCTAQCLFAPYFPPDQPQKFAHVHKVFGVANVTKMLHELPPPHREDCVNSLAYEADARVQDPVYGCVGAISVLQQQVAHLQAQLSLATSEISRLRETFAIAAAAASTHNSSAVSNNTSPSDHDAAPGANVNGVILHHHHHQQHQHQLSSMASPNSTLTTTPDKELPAGQNLLHHDDTVVFHCNVSKGEINANENGIMIPASRSM